MSLPDVWGLFMEAKLFLTACFKLSSQSLYLSIFVIKTAEPSEPTRDPCGFFRGDTLGFK